MNLSPGVNNRYIPTLNNLTIKLINLKGSMESLAIYPKRASVAEWAFPQLSR